MIPLILILLAFILVYLASWYGGAKVDRYLYDAREATTITIQEDDPGWDCHTMGNLICGERGN